VIVPLEEEDYDLSMRIAQPSRKASRNQGLRSLLVHRLADTVKAVLRLPLSGGVFGVYCETCDKWHSVKTPPWNWKCPDCGLMFTMEFAVYKEVK